MRAEEPRACGWDCGSWGGPHGQGKDLGSFQGRAISITGSPLPVSGLT